VRFEADCLGSPRREHIERGVGRRGSAPRLRLDRIGPTRPNEFGPNEALYVERWKADGNLLDRLSLIADELEHVTIGTFHEPTVLVVADGTGRRAHANVCLMAALEPTVGREALVAARGRGHSARKAP
jgi:hypothetical protein